MDSAEINASQKIELNRIAKGANTRGVKQIDLYAYAGGSDAIETRKVALARALAVRSYLFDQGVKARVEVATFGPAAKDMAAAERVDLVAPGMEPQPSIEANKAFEPPPRTSPPTPADTRDLGSSLPPPPSPHVATAPPSVAAAASASAIRPAPEQDATTTLPTASLSFTRDSAQINDPAKAELDRIAKGVNARGLGLIELRAYADDTHGADVIEIRKVALARALAVRSYLIDRGVKARIEVGTFGPAPKGMLSSDRVDVVAPGI
jgi:outer membrane protein OmpA-like peptidoglycan-associated protein